MGEGLDVVDERRPAVHTALRGARRLHRGPGVAPGQEADQRRLLAGDVPVRDLGDTHIDRIGPGALREGGGDPGDLQPTFAKAQHRVPRTTAVAASTIPSITRCGATSSSTRSLTLAGSPSQPFATTTGRPRPAATAASLRAVGKPATAATAQAGAGHGLDQPARPARCRKAADGQRPVPRGGARRGRPARPSRPSPRAAEGRTRAVPTEIRRGGRHRSPTSTRRASASWSASPQPDDDRGRDRQRAPGVDGPHPTEAGVRAADAQPVHERHRPQRIGREVQHPPQPRTAAAMRSTLVTTRARSRSAAAAPSPSQNGW